MGSRIQALIERPLRAAVIVALAAALGTIAAVLGAGPHQVSAAVPAAAASPGWHLDPSRASDADSSGTVADSQVPPQVQFPVGGAAMQLAEQIAVQHWGWAPCGGNVSINWTTLDPSLNALSTWWNPIAAYGNPQANADCQIALNESQSFDWPMFCTILVHEFGHLTGHQHVADPSDVMYPTYVQPIAQCQTASAASSTASAPKAAKHVRHRHKRRARVAARHRRKA
jgi:hypothetical protein